MIAGGDVAGAGNHSLRSARQVNKELPLPVSIVATFGSLRYFYRLDMSDSVF